MSLEKSDVHTPPNARWWVKAFVLFHIIAITTYTIPNPGRQYLTGVAKPEDRGGVGAIVDRFLLTNDTYGRNGITRAYVQATGFWQYWDMFSPNPASIDYYGDADLVYKDGTKAHYQYPRVYLYPVLLKYPVERYRKYFERAKDLSYLWQPFAQRVALLNTHDRNNPVVHVELHVHAQQVAPPGMPPNTTYSDKLFYKADVDQDQLMRDFGG